MAPRPNPSSRQRKREELLESVMRREHRALLAVAARFSHNHQDAEDALEDACILFLRHFGGEEISHAESWMRVTTKHAALKIIKRNTVRRHRDAAPPRADRHDEWWEQALPDLLASPEEHLGTRERVALLAELKPHERTALLLSALGYSYLEIGAREGWSQRKVKRCIAEGRARLRELLLTRGVKS